MMGQQTVLDPSWPEPPAPRGPGRPRLSDEEKQRRGTFEPAKGDEVLLDGGVPVYAVPPRAYAEIAADYAAGVLSGAMVACRWIRLAMARDAADLARGEAWPYVFDPDAGAAACWFLEQLPHVEGAWSSKTVVLEPSQVWLITRLFGWRRRADRTVRRFTNVYYEMGRKGAKSTLAAGIALYHVLCEGELGAAAICGATTGNQARIVFSIVQRMVRRSAWLRAWGLTAFQHSVVSEDAVIKAINAKARTQDGLNPSCIVLDEAHAQSFELHDVLKSAQGARRNPLMLCPTTAGYNLLSVGYALRGTVIKVLEGAIVADHLLGLIYTLDAGDDWRDPAVWVKANPMLGVTPALEFVASYCADAIATPALEGEFRVKVCSEWASASSAWLSLSAWDACADPSLTIEAFAGQPCFIGGDLAQIDDLAAVAYVFPQGEVLIAFVQFYLPALVVKDRARAVPEYEAWARAGLLTLTDGNMIDHARIEADVRAACRRFQVRDIVFDVYGSVQLVGALANEGYPARVEPKNARTMTGPARELEARVRHGRLRHDGNTCLRWQASNVVVTRRTDDTLLPKKEHADSVNKIDGIDALLQAIGGVLRMDAAAPEITCYVI